MRARVAALIVLVLLSWPVIAQSAQTNNTNNTLQKITHAANQFTSWLKTIAYIVFVAAAFIGVINYVFGRGPEWLGRVAMGAVALAVVLWFIAQVFPK